MVDRGTPPIEQVLDTLARYEQVLEAAGYVIFTADARGNFIDVSAPAERLTGYAREELIGRRFTDLVLPAWTERVETFYVEQYRERIEETILEFPIVTRDAGVKWVEQTVLLIQEGAALVFRAIVHDITDRRLTEETLRASEHFVVHVANTVPDIVYVYDFAERRTIYTNREVSRRLGYSPEQIQDMGAEVVSRLAHPDDLGLVEDYRSQLAAARNGEILEVEFRAQHASGEWRWMFSRETVFRRGADGAPLQILGIAQDITALKQSEMRYKAMLDAIPDVIFRFSREGRVLDLKYADANDLPVEPDAIPNRLLPEFLPPDLAAMTMNYIDWALATQTIQSFEYQLETPAGTQDFEARMVAVEQDEVFAIVRNITARKRAQDALNKRIEQLTALRRLDVELADRLDVNYVLTIALDAGLRLSGAEAGYIGVIEEGYLHLAKVVGNYDQDLIEPTVNAGKDIVARAIRQQKSELVLDLQSDPDHVIRVHNMRARIVIPLVSHERVIGVLNVEAADPRRFSPEVFQFLEILTARIAAGVDNAWLHARTEQQLAELQALYERVSQLEQLKTDMIRIASHDLRTPLGTIMGYMEFLRNDMSETATPSQREWMNTIDRGAQRMLKIISDILSLERIKETAQQATQEHFDLSETVERVFQDQRPQAQLKSQQFEGEIPDYELIVYADPVQIYEALANLMSNAIKYMPGGGRVTVSLATDGAQAIFAVTDTGYGIPEEHQARLFEPFYRARTKETRQVEGTGLGLHLVKSIVERYGGQMQFHSVHGKGSTFGFTLPLAQK